MVISQLVNGHRLARYLDPYLLIYYTYVGISSAPRLARR